MEPANGNALNSLAVVGRWENDTDRPLETMKVKKAISGPELEKMEEMGTNECVGE